MPATQSQEEQQRARALHVQQQAARQIQAQKAAAATQAERRNTNGKKIKELEEKVSQFNPSFFWGILIIVTLFETIVGFIPVFGSFLAIFVSFFNKSIRFMWYLFMNSGMKEYIKEHKLKTWTALSAADMIPFINMFPWTLSADILLFKGLYGEYQKYKSELQTLVKK